MHALARVAFTAAILVTPAFAAAQTPLRVVTWNVEGVGTPGSFEYLAVLAVLHRLGPDVVGINEVSGTADEGNLATLASDAGYPYLVIGGAPFSGPRNALLSRHPIASSVVATSAMLSQDPGANDITREIVVATIDLPGAALDPTIAVMHWKSSNGNDDEFRRTVESLRVAQTLGGLDPATDAFIVVGDVNEELSNVPGSPAVFTSLPSGLPGSFTLGADLASELSGPGLPNNPFAPIMSTQATTIDAVQKDGGDATRPSSGRRLDYVFASPQLMATEPASEVFDAQDEGLSGGIPKYGTPVASTTTNYASDHLPVAVDFVVPDAGSPPPPPPPAGGDVWINEIHYDNDGGDTNEGVEVVGEAGTDLTGWSIVFYNGNGGVAYDTVALSGTLGDDTNGFGFLTVARSGIQNGAPDGVALVDAGGNVVELLSYEGVLQATDGPAAGLTSADIGVAESPTTPVGFSLQRAGVGSQGSDFTFAAASASTFGAINTNQTLVCTSCPPNVWINELHYDNAGADTNEGVEIAGTAGVDLTGWQLVAYNGNDGSVYDTVSLGGTIPVQQNGLGAVFFAMSGLQNGAPDAVALVAPDGAVIELLSYEGTMTPVDGPAMGIASTNIGVSEDGSTPVGWSLQRAGVGNTAAAFTWMSAAASTYGAVNTNQTFAP